jgi:hypothetical protein
LRYSQDLQIPYRKVQHVLADLFGMPMVPASAMAFDRQATHRGRPLYAELQAMLKSSPGAYADETSWREDGQGRYVWFAGQPLDYPAAETLRDRIMNKDDDRLFTFLRVPGVEPTNNHSERSLRFLVIMRKISFGTRSAAGTESHRVLPFLLETARRLGQNPIAFLVALLTQPPAVARATLLAGAS